VRKSGTIEIWTMPRSFAFCKALLIVCREQNSFSAIVSWDYPSL
jgi:hypothetical protein